MTINLYKEYRNKLDSEVAFLKDKEYLDYYESKYPRMDLHHLLGSIFGKKFTDYLIWPLSHEFHIGVVEQDRAKYFSIYLAPSIILLINYRNHLIGEKPLSKLDRNITPEFTSKLITEIRDIKRSKDR